MKSMALMLVAWVYHTNDRLNHTKIAYVPDRAWPQKAQKRSEATASSLLCCEAHSLI